MSLSAALRAASFLPELLRGVQMPSRVNPIEVSGEFMPAFDNFSPPPEPPVARGGGWGSGLAPAMSQGMDQNVGRAWDDVLSLARQPQGAQIAPPTGALDPKRALMMGILAIVSRLFDKSGNAGEHLIRSGIQQGAQMQNAKYQQDLLRRDDEQKARAQQMDIANLILRKATGDRDEFQQNRAYYSDLERKKAQDEEAARRWEATYGLQLEDLGAKADERRLTREEAARKESKEDVEKGAKAASSAIEAKINDFNQGMRSAFSQTAGWGRSQESTWAQKRAQLKAEGVPGNRLDPVPPSGTMSGAAAGRDLSRSNQEFNRTMRQSEFDRGDEDRRIKAEEAAKAEREKHLTPYRNKVQAAENTLSEAETNVDALRSRRQTVQSQIGEVKTDTDEGAKRKADLIKERQKIDADLSAAIAKAKSARQRRDVAAKNLQIAENDAPKASRPLPRREIGGKLPLPGSAKPRPGGGVTLPPGVSG